MFLERPMRRGQPARPLLPATRGSPSEGARSATHGAVSSRPGLLGQVLRSQTARAGDPDPGVEMVGVASASATPAARRAMGWA